MGVEGQGKERGKKRGGEKSAKGGGMGRSTAARRECWSRITYAMSVSMRVIQCKLSASWLLRQCAKHQMGMLVLRQHVRSARYVLMICPQN